MSNINEKKKDMVLIARRCSDRNVQTGDGGNISVRFGDNQMIIMASRSSFADCNEDNFVVTDFNCTLVHGTVPPSREGMLHAAVYKKFKHINAILHCHSPYATAWASTMNPLPFSTYHAEKKLKEQLRVFDTESYIVTEEKVTEIMNQYDSETDLRGFLLKKHGSFAFGDNIFEANYFSELIEETAQIQILCDLLPQKQSI
ncbi:MAG: class II aldolase/adducin family protein [Eubacteriales bacterium]